MQFLANHNGKRLYVQLFNMADTAFSYGRALIICQFVQESFKVKESSLQIWNADITFLLSGPGLVYHYSTKPFLITISITSISPLHSRHFIEKPGFTTFNMNNASKSIKTNIQQFHINLNWTNVSLNWS